MVDREFARELRSGRLRPPGAVEGQQDRQGQARGDEVGIRAIRPHRVSPFAAREDLQPAGRTFSFGYRLVNGKREPVDLPGTGASPRSRGGGGWCSPFQRHPPSG